MFYLIFYSFLNKPRFKIKYTTFLRREILNNGSWHTQLFYPKPTSNFTYFLDTSTASHEFIELIIHDVDSLVGKCVPSCKVEG